MSTNFASAITSLGFSARNVDKAVRKDEIPRGLIAVGQVGNAVNSIMALDNAIGKSAKTAVDILEKYSKQEKLLSYAGQGVKFISDHINPLLCISAGIKVLRSDDKETALVQETAAMSAMFAGEALMKKHMDKIVKVEGIDKIADKVVAYSSKTKARGVIPSVIKGTAFVAGSILASTIGRQVGTLVTDNVMPKKTSE